MKNQAKFSVVTLAAVLAAGHVCAQSAGSWMVRAGATNLAPAGPSNCMTAPVSFSPYSLRRATQASSPLMADARSGVAVGRVGVLRGGARRSGSWRGCLVGEAIMKRSTAFRNSSSSGGGAGGE